MTLNFVKANASGNTTVFILDPVPREHYMQVAQKIMEDRSVGAEQVGFISKDAMAGMRMDMMGGEFCGNASRSFAAWLTLWDEGGLTLKNIQEDEKQMEIEVSGHSGVLTAHVSNLGADNKCNVSVSMPLPQEIFHGSDDFFGDYSIVIFEGISHFVLWDRVEQEGDFERAQAFLINHGADVSSFGIMYHQRNTGFMRPLVYIGNANTLIWENSCGSGSCALAAALADKQKSDVCEMTIPQPGGDLTVTVRWQKGIRNIVLSGIIEITATGTVYID